jgi:hypothetical protein
MSLDINALQSLRYCSNITVTSKPSRSHDNVSVELVDQDMDKGMTELSKLSSTSARVILKRKNNNVSRHCSSVKRRTLVSCSSAQSIDQCSCILGSGALSFMLLPIN